MRVEQNPIWPCAIADSFTVPDLHRRIKNPLKNNGANRNYAKSITRQRTGNIQRRRHPLWQNGEKWKRIKMTATQFHRRGLSSPPKPSPQKKPLCARSQPQLLYPSSKATMQDRLARSWTASFIWATFMCSIIDVNSGCTKLTKIVAFLGTPFVMMVAQR